MEMDLNKAVAGVGMGMNELKRMQTRHSETNTADHRKLEVTLERINERTDRHASQYYGSIPDGQNTT